MAEIVVEPHCRIGKVTLKASNLTVFTSRADAARREMIGRFAEHAGMISGWLEETMAGYLIVAWSMNGSSSAGWRMHNKGPVQLETLAMYLTTGVIPYLIARDAVHDMIDLPAPPVGA